MNHYPIFLNVRGRPCLVVGGGEIAERKVESLLSGGARVTVISPTLTPRLSALAETHEIMHHAREYRPGDLKGFFLAYAATDREEVHQRMAREAEEERVLLNVVDRPGLCTFIVPSVISRGELTIAISTGGASPAMAKRLRHQLEEIFGPEYQQALEMLGKLREKLRETLPSEDRQRIFTDLANSALIDYLREGRHADIDALLLKVIGQDITLEGLGISARPMRQASEKS